MLMVGSQTRVEENHSGKHSSLYDTVKIMAVKCFIVQGPML